MTMSMKEFEMSGEEKEAALRDDIARRQAEATAKLPQVKHEGESPVIGEGALTDEQQDGLVRDIESEALRVSVRALRKARTTGDPVVAAAWVDVAAKAYTVFGLT